MAVKQTKKKPVAALAVEGEEKSLHNYEMVIVTRPGVTDADNEQVAESLKQLVTGLGGEITKIEPWGKKKLAYQIAHLSEGYYVLICFSMKPDKTREMESKLNLNEQVLRHMLIAEEN